MPGSARTRKSTLLNDLNDRKEKNHSSREQPSKAESRRTHLIREPVTSIEHAMDIAIGDEGEPWNEWKKAA